MSRCAHAQSTYKLATMPKCPKCKGEMTIIYGQDEIKKEILKEWECMKCGRTFSTTRINGPEFSGEDQWLHEWCKRNDKR